jgi:fumarate reductase subunit D
MVKAEGARALRKADMSHAVWWGLFAAGGMVAAILLPIHILLQGVLGPLGVVPVAGSRDGTLATALANPLVRLYLFVLISAPLFHAAHRIRFVVMDLGLHGGRTAIAVLCYGGAILGTCIAAYVLATV